MPPSSPEDRAKASAAAAAASWAQVSQEVDSVEAALHALRGQYEQYFLGLEKRPPVKAHEQYKKRLAELRKVPSRNSALSFRIQSLQASTATYERLWTKTLQEMEDGTYRRDLFKARMRSRAPRSRRVPRRRRPDPSRRSTSPGRLHRIRSRRAGSGACTAPMWR